MYLQQPKLPVLKWFVLKLHQLVVKRLEMCLMSLLINLRVLAEQYVFAAAQAACLSSDVGGPSAGSIRKKEGPRPGSIRIRRAITAWNTSQHWYFFCIVLY